MIGGENIEEHRDCSNSSAVLFNKNRSNLILAMLGVVFKASAVLGFSVFTQKIIDTISGQKVSTLPNLCIFALLCTISLVIGAVLEYVFWTGFRSRALTQYREHVCRKILSKEISAFGKEGSATYISLISNDLNQIRTNYIEMLPYVAELIFSFCGTVVLMLRYDVKLSLIAFVVSLLPIVLSSFRMKQIEECEVNMAEANGCFLGAFAEVIQGFRSVKSMKAENAIAIKLQRVNEAASAAFRKREHVEISVAYIASLTGHMAQLVFFFASMFLSKSGEKISVGMIVVFVQLMQHISQLGITMPELIANIKASLKLMEKHEEFLAVYQASGEAGIVSCRDEIQMEHVSAGYGSSGSVLRDISLQFHANGCYAIIGESGSGKSTLLNLLSGSIRDYSGIISYDKLSIREISNESLFELVSVIQQDVFIFDASIRDNITMFCPSSEEELREAIWKAGLTDLIEQKGLEYLCGENGNMLSGGERQRIGIARSILKKNGVLLLDEATSALDASTGYQIIDTIQRMEDTTRIVVTHDIYPELMERFDCVYVLSEGRVVERGKFKELLERKGVCWTLVNKIT